MRHIKFSDVGVVVKSLEEVEEVHMTLSALGVSFADDFDSQCTEAQQANLEGYFIQCTTGDIRTSLHDAELYLSIIDYPITYSMEVIDFAIACQLINTDREDELIAHLDKYCKEYK